MSLIRMNLNRPLQNLRFSELLDGAEKAVINGKSLIEEARLLLEHKHFARAYALAHLNREELSKLSMLYRAGLDVLLGNPVDWKNLYKRFRSHKHKIASDRLLSLASTGFSLVRLKEISEGKGAPLAAEESLVQTVSKRSLDYWNDRKNSSLYTEWADGAFQKPDDRFSELQAARTIRLAEFSAEDAERAVRSLGEWGKMPLEELKAFWAPRLKLAKDAGSPPVNTGGKANLRFRPAS
jgi:AbiV family abortive infection protein